MRGIRRLLRLLAGAWLLPLAGCSALLVAGGEALTALTTRAEVQHRFGPPSASGVEKDGQGYDCYTLRRKLARSQGWQQGHGMITACTFGLSELLLFPLELSRAS